MQALLRSIGVPVLVLRREEDGLVRLEAANEDACLLFSFEAAAASGLPLHDFLPPALADELTRAAAQAILVQGGVGIEHTMPERWMRLTLRPLEPDPKDRVHQGAWQQISCTVSAQHSAERPQELALESGINRLRLRLLDRLVARGGHALGNYLQPILTFSRYAMGELPAATRESYLGYVIDAGEQIHSLIAVARIVGRAGAGHATKWAEVSIDHLLEDVEDVCPMLLPIDVSIRRVIEVPGATADSCRGYLILVLLNLVLNAADSLIRKGEIILHASRGDYADRLMQPPEEAGPCVRIDVESVGERQIDESNPAQDEAILRLIRRCGGGLEVSRPSPDAMRVSIFLPERVESGATAAG